jgi:carotenoid cleavage dioxygenase-like enzyme
MSRTGAWRRAAMRGTDVLIHLMRGALQVRGPTVPGNLDGTVLRNGATHHRRPKTQP